MLTLRLTDSANLKVTSSNNIHMTNKTYKIAKTLEVQRIGLGTMRLTAGEGKWGMPPDKQNAIKVLRKAVEIGVDFFDTANTYGPEISESIIAEALYPYADNIVIGTKGGNEIFAPNDVRPNCHPDNLRNTLHGSLRRLKLERIDLYQLHTVDPKVEIEFSIEALAKLRDEGKIRFIGVSNIDLQNLKRALTITKIDSIQNRYNQIDKSSETIIRFAEELEIAFFSYYPLAKGELSKNNNFQNKTNGQLTLAQKSLLWQLKQFSNLIPIPGTTSVDHLTENFMSLKYLQQ